MKYKSKNHIIFIIDLCAMLISFIIAYVIRFSYWTEIEEMQVVAGKELIVLYFEFFCAAFALYALVVYFKGRIRLERQSYGEILLAVTKEQFDKMKYSERAKLYEEQPELYKELIK